MIKIAEFDVLGFDPVPWSVPHFGSGTSKKGKKFRFSTRRKKSNHLEMSMSLEDWQATIATHARIACLDRIARLGYHCMHEGPVLLGVRYIKETPPGRRHGEIWFTSVERDDAKSLEKGKEIYKKTGQHEPDLTNLTKAVEDALEGSVLGNDYQVVGHSTMRIYGPVPGIRVTLWGYEAHDYPGEGDPVPMPPPKKRKPRKSTPCRVDAQAPEGTPPRASPRSTRSSSRSAANTSSSPAKRRGSQAPKNESDPSGPSSSRTS